MLQCGVVCFSVFQRVAMCCSVLQCVAVLAVVSDANVDTRSVAGAAVSRIGDVAPCRRPYVCLSLSLSLYIYVYKHIFMYIYICIYIYIYFFFIFTYI